VIPSGTTCNAPIYGIDFMPTLSEVTSGSLPTQQPVDGESLVPLFSGATSLKRETMYWHFPLYLAGKDRQNFTPLRGGHPTQGQGWRAVPSSAIRKGDWKLIERFETSNIELYNIKDDISEQNDLTTHHPEKATELLTDLKLWQRDTQAIIPKDPNTLYDAGYELSIAQS
jgi:arylsulfatase A-like enzyme